MVVSVSRLERVPPREVWESEPRDFTPWLANNLSILGEALGLDLELVGMEADVGGYSCDLHAVESGTGRVVIVENQLEQTDHGHLGQLLTYAAGLDAAVVVWISPLVRDEHREAVDFLNRHTLEGIDFFMVELELVRIGDSPPAVVFRLVASPNAWAKRMIRGGGNGSGALPPRQEAYRRFWQPLMDELRERRFTNAKVAQPQSWYAFASGISGAQYCVAFYGRTNLRAEIYIDVGDRDRNKAAFDFLAEKSAELEREFGEPLQWERLDAKKASRIFVALAETRIEDAEERGDEMRAWLVERLLRLKRTFGPLLGAALEAGFEHGDGR
jgi:hypothetical protein